MATPNYGYEKRQKELAKKRKKEEKLKNRAERGDVGEEAGDTPTSETTSVADDKSEPN
ncbi:hypothetical protein [Undibacterium sp.]|uniref:hypothetical protein n=1 Tax=Undibacterium sp. TaxID=1914977 RepID=UPI003751FBA8